MNTYLLIKTLHILSSVLLVGTGFGSAFYLFLANRTGSAQAISAPMQRQAYLAIARAERAGGRVRFNHWDRVALQPVSSP